ncbi:unnamed protein product [Urochloa decumbens]|uniref:No apical meristem-associated C-terminal domain-containing protein n=1 Tax=Urochloa decumbens TaxID=240449 RepID=A0ABC9B269_9POAL
MNPSSSAAQTVAPDEQGDASVRNDGTNAQEVQAQGYGRKGRQKKAGTRIKLGNFNPNEDVLLVKSYAEIGDDPITNTGQKKDRFWERITERYNSERAGHPERSLRSLQSRFEIISKEVSKFASWHARVVRDNPSGMTDADKTTNPSAKFAGALKCNFQYLHCWEIMQHLPKWQDPSGTAAAAGADVGQETINLGDEDGNPTASAGMRPMGRDSAKAAKKKASASAGSSSSTEYATRMQDLSIERNALMQEEAVRKNERFQQLASINEKQLEDMRSHNQAMVECEREKTRIMREKHDMEKLKQDMDRQKEEKLEDERILHIDLDACTPAQRLYYEELQSEIIEKVALRRRKRQGHQP